jgi:hypothetical protein
VLEIFFQNGLSSIGNIFKPENVNVNGIYPRCDATSTLYDMILYTRCNAVLHFSHRCVEEKDKPIAMGFGMTMGSLCAFIPSPILFGIILGKDDYCYKLVR